MRKPAFSVSPGYSPPSLFGSSFSDTSTYLVIVYDDGQFSDHTSENEEIKAGFYSREEIREMLKTEEFSSVPRRWPISLRTDFLCPDCIKRKCKMKTLYVTDLDGTLLRTDDTVSPFTINTVNGLVDKGMLLLMRRPVLWFPLPW